MNDIIHTLLTQEYSIHLAANEEDYQAVKDLRYEMYGPIYNLDYNAMDEKGYLFSEDDAQSFNYLLRHNTSNTYVGTVRLFFINDTTPIKQLPMQKDGNVDDINHLTQGLPICEVSRLALSSTLPSHETLRALQLRTCLTVGLMVAIRLNCFLYPYKDLFTVMEKSLARILKRQDANFKVIGEPTEYYGIRIPYSIERKKLLRDTNEKGSSVTLYYLKEICKNPKTFLNFIDNHPYLKRSDIKLEKICKIFNTYGENVDLAILLEEKTNLS